MRLSHSRIIPRHYRSISSHYFSLSHVSMRGFRIWPEVRMSCGVYELGLRLKDSLSHGSGSGLVRMIEERCMQSELVDLLLLLY